MAVLSTHTPRRHRLHEPITQAIGIRAGNAIYLGALVNTLSATGNAYRATDSANYRFSGVAVAGYDNTNGSNGVVEPKAERYCVVDKNGIWFFAYSGATPGLEDPVYVFDDNTVSVATTNAILVGKVWRVSSGGVWVNIAHGTGV